jgi:hypothetical protein
MLKEYFLFQNHRNHSNINMNYISAFSTLTLIWYWIEYENSKNTFNQLRNQISVLNFINWLVLFMFSELWFWLFTKLLIVEKLNFWNTFSFILYFMKWNMNIRRMIWMGKIYSFAMFRLVARRRLGLADYFNL